MMKLYTRKCEHNRAIRGGVIAISIYDLDFEHVFRVALGSRIIFTKFDIRHFIRAEL